MQIDHQKSREIFAFHKGSSENQNSIQERLFSPRRSFSILFPPSKITPLSNAGSTTKGSNRRHVIIFYFPSLSLPPWVAARNRKTTRWIKETGERIGRDRRRGKEFNVCCSSAFTLEFLFVSRITGNSIRAPSPSVWVYTFE